MTEPRATNAMILARLDAMDARLGRIDTTTQGLEQRMRSMESSNDQQHPLIDERIGQLAAMAKQHEDRLRALEQAVTRLEQTNRLLTWLLALIGAGTLGWIVTNLLEGIK